MRGYKSGVPVRCLTSSEHSAVGSCRGGVSDKEVKLPCSVDLCMAPSPATRDNPTWTLEMLGAQTVPSF